MLTLRNKFDALKEKIETYTPNDEYDNFINVHLEATAECIPTKQRDKPRILWEILAVRKFVQTRELLPNAKVRTIYLKEQTEYVRNQINKIKNRLKINNLG